MRPPGRMAEVSERVTTNLHTKTVGFGGFDPNQLLAYMGWVSPNINGTPHTVRPTILSYGNYV
eukprot:13138591-Heterocapsa_arctica.AAC.1